MQHFFITFSLAEPVVGFEPLTLGVESSGLPLYHWGTITKKRTCIAKDTYIDIIDIYGSNM